MSYKVTEAFISQSQSKHGARTVGLIIAEVAHHDGVGWLRIEPSKSKHRRSVEDVDNIVFRTKLSAKQVRRCVDRLQDLDEIEVVRAWDGRKRFHVYRLIIEPIRLRDVDYERGGLSELEADFWTPEELQLPVLERPTDGHEYSPAQIANLGTTRGQNVPSSVVESESPRGDIGPPDERTSAQPPYRGPVQVTVQTEEANASPVPADAGERESLKVEIELALSAELGVQLVGMTRSSKGAWEFAIAELVDVGATRQDVAVRCAAFRTIWPTMQLTANALARHWPMLGAQVAIDASGGGLDRWLETVAPTLDPEHAHDIIEARAGLTDRERAALHARLEKAHTGSEHERRVA